MSKFIIANDFYNINNPPNGQVALQINQKTGQIAVIINGKTISINGSITKNDVKELIKNNVSGSFILQEGTRYKTLTEAIDATSGQIKLKLNDDIQTPSFKTEASNPKTIQIDLNENELIMTDPLVGSPGTVSQAFHFEKGSKVTFKNGTLVFPESAKMGIQNYGDLTLDNVKVFIDNKFNNVQYKKYAVSNNFGNITFKNGTEIHTQGTSVAFDLYYGMNAIYDDGVYVTIQDGVIIDGPIEYAKADRITNQNWMEKCVLKVHKNVQINPPEGYKFEIIESQPQYKKLVKI